MPPAFLPRICGRHRNTFNMKKKKAFGIILILGLSVGAALLLYPTISNYWNSFHQSKAVAAYIDSMQRIDSDDSTAIIESAVEYNEKLLDQGLRLFLNDEEKAEYEQTLDITGTGIMGYIEIPCINVALPIFHGTSDEVLQIAVGHVEGTSLPVGGKGCHTVLSGHRGLASAKLFTDLYKLTEGDVFTITVLDTVVTYEVDRIRTVLPDEIDELKRDVENDYCTLVTCTPYSVNTHRLLVRGHRIENAESASTLRVTADAYRVEPTLVAPVLFFPLLMLLTVWLMIDDRIRKKEERYLDEMH